MSIWAHTLVKNEERYIWFSVTSVINWVDRILLWDTGSTDDTLKIVRELKNKYPEKIDFNEVGEIDINEFTVVRNEMLKKTKSDWFMIVDGDEVWWDESISEIIKVINSQGNNLDSIVTRNFNVVGDIFHHQEEKAGMYEIDGVKGYINIRAVNRRIPGISFKRPHGQQGIFDEKGILIQDRDKRRRIFLKKPAYLHFTNMLRSSSFDKDKKVPKRKIKFKYELGMPFPSDFYYPEVFFKAKPKIMSSLWVKMSEKYFTIATLERPLKYVKRSLPIFKKSGY